MRRCGAFAHRCEGRTIVLENLHGAGARGVVIPPVDISVRGGEQAVEAGCLFRILGLGLLNHRNTLSAQVKQLTVLNLIALFVVHRFIWAV